ncbi:MAG: GGDEF domain-containing protein [Xanthomonadales bacterium]|nr:GGDEF domain-containing protein [Xanthomonadales bacterium]
MHDEARDDAALRRRFGDRRDLMLAKASPKPIVYVAVGVVAFAVWDAWLDPSALARTLPIRLATALLLVVPYVLLRRRWPRGRRARWLHGSVYLIGILGITAATLQLEDGFLWGAAGISVFPLVLAVYPLPARTYLGLSALAAFGIALLVAICDAPTRQLINFIVMFSLSVWVGVTALQVLRKQQWRLFVLEQQHAADARTDALTGLFNRRHVEQLGRRQFDVATRLERPLAVVMIDLDHFKQINDQHGHDVGDRALILTATVLRKALREVDLIARWGGEEFLAILVDSDAEQAFGAAERFLQRLRASEPAQPGSPSLWLTASAGVSVHAPAAEGQRVHGFDELVRHADLALYEAKRGGRDRAVLYGAPGSD